MYQICMLLLKFVRRYCVHCCGDSWHNLWHDIVSDAQCLPAPPPVVQPPAFSAEAFLERSLKIISVAELLHAALTVAEPDLFDIEDIKEYLDMHLELFGASLDQLDIERPASRPITRLLDLYNEYMETK